MRLDRRTEFRSEETHTDTMEGIKLLTSTCAHHRIDKLAIKNAKTKNLPLAVDLFQAPIFIHAQVRKTD